MNNSFRKSRKAIVALLIFVMVFTSFSPMFARKAEAFILTDWVNFAVNAITSVGINSIFVKEYALDAVAYKILDLIIQRITASTVNWINGGFRGSPAFISNPGEYFGDLGDKIAGQFIFENQGLNFLCSPIRLKIKLALTANYLQDDTRWQCTLTEVGKNIDAFMGDFENGGWENFFELTQKRQNNPIGAYLQAEQELNIRIANQTVLKEKEFDWGRGFMTMKRCKTWSDSTGGAQTPSSQTDGGFDGAQTPDESYYNTLPDDPVDETAGGRVCIDEETTTPGAVIEGKLGGVLNIGSHKLAVADELNEIINALLNQLTAQIVGGIGKGLRGLSNIGSGGEPSSTSRISNTEGAAAIDQYFDNSQNIISDTLNAPPIDPYLCRDNPTAPECLPPPGAPCDPGVDTSCVANP